MNMSRPSSIGFRRLNSSFLARTENLRSSMSGPSLLASTTKDDGGSRRPVQLSYSKMSRHTARGEFAIDSIGSVLRYLEALGTRADDPDFFTSAVLLQGRDKARSRWTASIEEARRERLESRTTR